MTKQTPRKRWTKETYAEYLKTERWQTLRESKLDEVGHRCQLCNGDGVLHVHHRCYDNLGQEGERRDLVVLCKDCHSKFHETDSGTIQDWTANSMLAATCRLCADIMMDVRCICDDQRNSNSQARYWAVFNAIADAKVAIADIRGTVDHAKM